MLRLLTLCLVLLWAAGAQAASTTQWGRDCSHTASDDPANPSRSVTLIGAGEHAGGLPKIACLGWGDNVITSDVLQVRADSVLFTFVDDVAGTSATATAAVEKCPCDPNITLSGNTCLDILDTPLTGTEGSPTTQNASVRAGPGCYRVVTVGGTATDHPFLLAEAEE